MGVRVDAVDDQRQFEAAEPLKIELDPIDAHRPRFRVEPVIDEEVTVDMVEPGHFLQIDAFARLRIDRDAFDLRLHKGWRLVFLEAGEIEFLDRDLLDRDGVFLVGAVGLVGEGHPLKHEAVVAERLGALVGQGAGRNLRLQQLLELRQAVRHRRRRKPKCERRANRQAAQTQPNRHYPALPQCS